MALAHLHRSSALLQQACCSLQQVRGHYSQTALRQPSSSNPRLIPDQQGRPSTSGPSSQLGHKTALGLFEGLLQPNRGDGPASTSAAASPRERQGSGLSVAASAAMADHLASSQASQQVRGFHMKEAPLEVKMESQMIFESAWRRFQERHGTHFQVPREVVWLNGAPGSGKGVSTPYILQARNMSRSVCMSTLLASMPEARKFIDAGEMISDALVADVLLETLLARCGDGSEYGLVVDGFPRTACQVDFLKLLHERLQELHTRYADTPLASRFPRPNFKVVMLYVDEATSVGRQLSRAAAASAHNRRVIDAGGGQLREERSTDVSTEKASKRYQIFRRHYSAILRLKQFFPFHLIDAMGPLHDTQEQIAQELRYQSSLDLSEETYTAVRALPLARDLQRAARQQLVTRLEAYNSGASRATFHAIIQLLELEALPLLKQGGLSGRAEWSSQDALFESHPDAVAMVVDVLSDRGFMASYAREHVVVPVRFDVASGRIESEKQPLHKFSVRYEGASDNASQAALKAMEIAARFNEARGLGGGCGGRRAAGTTGFAASGLRADAGECGPSCSGCGGSCGEQHQQAGAAAVGVSGVQRHTPVTMSFLPEHLLERRRRQQQAQQQGQQDQSADEDAEEAMACGASS